MAWILKNLIITRVLAASYLYNICISSAPVNYYVNALNDLPGTRVFVGGRMLNVETQPDVAISLLTAERTVSS